MTLDHMGTVLFVSDDCADYIGLTPVSNLCIVNSHCLFITHCLINGHCLFVSHCLINSHHSFVSHYLINSHVIYFIGYILIHTYVMKSVIGL